MDPKKEVRITYLEKPKNFSLANDVVVMSRHQSCQCHGLNLMSRHWKFVGKFSIFSDQLMS